MNRIYITLSIVSIMLLGTFTAQGSTQWVIEEGYSVKFTSKDPTGVFTKMSGDISFDAENLDDSKFDVKVDVASINTGNGMKNKHAKSDKWFDAEQFPTINFTTTKLVNTEMGYEAIGKLEIHGVTKEFTMPFTFKDNVFTSSFTINRLDFNVGTLKGMSKKVPVELTIDITVPVSKN